MNGLPTPSGEKLVSLGAGQPLRRNDMGGRGLRVSGGRRACQVNPYPYEELGLT